MSVTEETRRESHRQVDKETLHKCIIEVLQGDVKLTAHEIAVILHKKGLPVYPVRQSVAPRLTELVQCGIVKADGKKYDSVTKRHVALYRLVRI